MSTSDAKGVEKAQSTAAPQQQQLLQLQHFNARPTCSMTE